MKHLLAALLLGTALLTAGCGDDRKAEAPASGAAPEAAEIPFRADGSLAFLRGPDTLTAITIEIADNDSSRTRGLMQRSALPPKSGMLFIFDRAEPQSFWMANTPLALDLLFVGPDSQIVDIARYAQPFSPSAIGTPRPARFVVEVPAGFADTHGLIESDRVRWRRAR